MCSPETDFKIVVLHNMNGLDTGKAMEVVGAVPYLAHRSSRFRFLTGGKLIKPERRRTAIQLQCCVTHLCASVFI